MGLSTHARRCRTLLLVCLAVASMLANKEYRWQAAAFAVSSSLKVSRPTSATKSGVLITMHGARFSAPVARTSSRSSSYAAYASTDAAAAPSDTADQPPSQAPTRTRLRRLKDRMWVRETLEDLTSADFAASLVSAAEEAQDVGDKIGKKRAVDFENILSKLDRRVEEMCVVSTYGEASEALSCYPLGDEMSSPVTIEKGQKCYALIPGKGMGSVVYTDEQRDALLTRIVATKQKLAKEVFGSDAEPEPEAEDLDEIRMQLQVEQESKSDVAKKASDPYLYVRGDGTIDWDGALQDKEALKKFGKSVWARINGEDPESIDEESVPKEQVIEKKITVKIIETEDIKKEKAKLDALQKELRKMTADHTALLNSAVQVGNAVGTVNLASLDSALRAKIRSSTNALEKKEEEVSCQLMSYELERIYTYLDTELGNTATKGYIPLQDRLNVAEFGLLESQIACFDKQLKDDDFIVIDADVLAVVLDQLTDFKRRLGIDYYVTGLTYDWEAIQRWLADLLEKTKSGLAFYVKGCKLFWNDILYSLRLVSRALQGYTLQPREVRTLRRTFKDIITFIPVVIILLIPLSPVGHVLVFGAIQRVFPDFFPSCFTERRQNLLELYESTEYTEVVINESLQEKLARALEAGVFNIADAAKQVYKGPDDSKKSG